jgi:thiol-disulfide isomerase/thioredoxin
MRAKGIQISNLLVAPGYNLNLTGNGKDHSTLFESKRISGVGAQSNRFSFLFDSLLIARGPGVDWLSLNEQELPRYSNQLRKLKDSLADVVFNKPATDDKYFSFFGSMVRLDNLFSQLAMLVTHVTWNDYKYSKAVSFVKEHIDTKVLNDLFKEEYLISNAYTSFIGNEWLDYLVSLDYQQDSSLRHQRGYELKKINEAYKGKAREQALQRRITVSIELAKSLEVLNEQLAHIEKYGPTFTDQNKLEMLQVKYLGKKKELMQMQAGKPAPSFTLQGYDGRTYRLEDFRNKVIYLDLWASWCVPRRQEIPSLKLLHERYRNDDRIVFVSIAVLDRLDKWKAAIRTDKPTWIQLFDKDDLVAKSYFANAVPQFIIIDRNGNLVDFEAPWPSSGKKIIEVLDREIAK